VKGRRDVVASAEGIIREISEPCVGNMEPIGGTGDSLTGIVAALIHSGKSIAESAALGATINRFLGHLANPSPGCSIADLLSHMSDAVRIALSHE
jgi:ADP-dependent NAD(P)H-hydrate dehydratase / NAD(P)H-hydrate epimerase